MPTTIFKANRDLTCSDLRCEADDSPLAARDWRRGVWPIKGDSLRALGAIGLDL